MILKAAVALAIRRDYREVTRDAVATHAGVAPRLVSYYFGDMGAMRSAVMEEAVRMEILPIIIHGIVAKDPIATGAPVKLKARALDSIGG